MKEIDNVDNKGKMEGERGGQMKEGEKYGNEEMREGGRLRDR